MKTKKNLLVFASTFPRWKNDTNPPFVYELSKRLANDFNVSVLAPSFPGSKKFEKMDRLKVHRFRYFFKNFEKLAGSGGIMPTLKKNKLYWFVVPFFFLGEFIALRKIIKKEKIDIIHAHWIIPCGFIAAITKKLYNVDYVVTTHGGDIFNIRWFIPKMMKKFTLNNAKKITVVSNAIKKEILKKLNDKLEIDVIPMGVDSKLFNPNKKDLKLKEKYNIKGPFLLFVGRLADKKGVKYLIEAMPSIVKKFNKTKLLIIGNGPLEKELKELSNKLNMSKNIIFTGAIQNNELPKYYATADIFIGPSIETKEGDKEGLGLTFVEAGMSGCFLIGTNVGGISDVIKDGVNGFLVKEKSSKEISEKVKKVILKKLKSKNKSMEEFDVKNISSEYMRILR